MTNNEKTFRNSTYETFRKENLIKLFGEEDAGKESEDRLNSYYYQTTDYDKVRSEIKRQIVPGEKGTGKSALLKIAVFESRSKGIVPISIRLDDLSELYSGILAEENLYSLKTLWKKSISKLVMIKLVEDLDFTVNEDYINALTWAYDYGYKNRNFIDMSLKKLKPILEKYINTEGESNPNGEHHIFNRAFNEKNIRVFLDDFDLDWNGKASDVLRIKSLLLALSDMTSDMDNFSVRIALRTDVYEMIRNEEFSDKLENSVIKCKWNNQEIMKALAKRICAYFNKDFNEIDTNDKTTIQYNIIRYLNYIFVERFDQRTKVWANAPTHKVIYSLIRRKPRDMVKLCQRAAEQAYDKKLEIIDSVCITSILNSYSQERLTDLVNEYSNQLPNIRELLVRMGSTNQEIYSKKNERYVYTTDELYKKIRNIQQNTDISIFTDKRESATKANIHQIAHFLYKIGFITGRKRIKDGTIIRTYYDEKQDLLKQQIGDGGYSWEIHPAYRSAISELNNDKWEATMDPINDWNN